MEESIISNLHERAEIKISCDANIERQQAAYDLCKDNIVVFFKYWLWTFDPRLSPSDLPFVLYPFQEDYIKDLSNDIISGTSALTDKSRDMGVTWMILGVFLHRWLFHNETFLLGSRKEELVDKIGDMDSLFERLRYMIAKLPDWMLELAGYDRKDSAFMRIYKGTGVSLTGESMNKDFSRQGRYKAILLDEYAFVDSPSTIWRACGDSAPCKLPISTPNGKNNFFAQLRHGGKIKTYSLHWTKHPKKDKAWYDKECENRSAKDAAQELDINYNISAGDPFYIGFSRGIHLRKMRLNPEKPLILSWDYGFRHPNCSIHQISVEGIWIIVDNIFGENQTIDEFGEDVQRYLNQNYSEFRLTQGYGDPAGTQSSDKSRRSSEKILNDMGFKVDSIPSNAVHSNYDARKIIIEKRLRTLIGGIPSLVVQDVPNNSIIVEGFEGGYKTPDANKYGGVSEKPVEDGWYEHPFNTIEYFAINMFRKVEFQSKPKERGNPGRIPFSNRKKETVNAGVSF